MYNEIEQKIRLEIEQIQTLAMEAQNSDFAETMKVLSNKINILETKNRKIYSLEDTFHTLKEKYCESLHINIEPSNDVFILSHEQNQLILTVSEEIFNYLLSMKITRNIGASYHKKDGSIWMNFILCEIKNKKSDAFSKLFEKVAGITDHHLSIDKRSISFSIPCKISASPDEFRIIHA